MVSRLSVKTARVLTVRVRWRPLEAILVALGSVSESILDFCDDEQEAGRQKPIDVESLLTNVVPQLLALSGTYTTRCPVSGHYI